MNNSIKSAIFALTTVFIWSSAFPLTKVATEYISPNCLGLLRCTVASVMLLIIGKVCKIRLPQKTSHYCLFLISGGLGFSLYMISFNSGMVTLSSAIGSLVIATVPVLTAIGASVLYKERIKPLGWFCIGTAFAGVCILLLWGGEVTLGKGIFWIWVAAAVFCSYNLINRKLLSMGYTSIECVTWSMISGALWLIPFSAEAALQVQSAPASALLVVLYLGVMPSATAYLLWSKAFSLVEKTSEVTNYQFTTPLISTVLGFLILGEVPGMSTVVGGIVIIASIVVFGLKGK